MSRRWISAVTIAQIVVTMLLVLNRSDSLPQICKVPRGDAGRCVPVAECDPINKVHLNHSRTPEETIYIGQSAGSCNSKPSNIKVCCPPESKWRNMRLIPVKYPRVTVHNNMNSVPVHINIEQEIDQRFGALKSTAPSEREIELGQSLIMCSNNVHKKRPAIAGGRATKIEQYPWLALLEYGPNILYCGGSLITSNYVLTAAHCLQPSSPKRVRLSEYDIRTNPDKVERRGGGYDTISVAIFDVAETIIHEEYSRIRQQNDIGLVKLNETVTFGDFIKNICLPREDYKAEQFTTRTRLVVAGWGSDGEYDHNAVKTHVEVPYVPNDVCKEDYDTPIWEKHICAGGESGKDSCKGDSGGPLMYEDRHTFKIMLVGVVSFGKYPCGTSTPAVYTYVYDYIDWIYEKLGK